jgi:hypothetical protein
MRQLVHGLIIGSVVLLVAGMAPAQDVIGPVGTPAGLQVLTLSADTYLAFHGRLYVKNADNTLAEYRWGGTSCGTRVLSDAQVASLQAAIDNKKMRIEPVYQIGQADIKCVVGFSLVPKQNLALGIP